MNNMATGVFRLKGSKLRELSQSRGIENVHQVSMRSGVSYPTAYRYFEKPEQVESVSLRALYGVLVDGIGLTPAEVSDLRLGDILEQVPDNRIGAV